MSRRIVTEAQLKEGFQARTGLAGAIEQYYYIDVYEVAGRPGGLACSTWPSHCKSASINWPTVRGSSSSPR